MPYYKTLQKTTSNLLGNKLAKKYKIQKDFVIHKTKQQIQVITNDEVAYLIYDKYIIPTINYAIKNNLVEKRVYLDDKATKPILGGADVMAPGIFKFIDKCDDFNEDDVVFIEIENEIVGVGIAMVNKKSITSETKGVAVEVWQRMGDWSKNFAL